MAQQTPPVLPEQSWRQQVAENLQLHKTIRNLAAENIGEVCVVRIAFVSDHVETLGEIDHEAREEAAELGIEQFEMTAGLNDSPTFIAALADLVEDALGVGQCVTDRLVAAD